MESTTGIGFVDDRDDMFWLSRLRVTVTAQPAPWVRFTGQVQDARVGSKDVGPRGNPFSAPLDLRLAQAAFGHATSPLTLTVGRQELALGEQRLVGHVSWTNAARSFDGARLTARRKGLQADGFVASVVRNRPDEWDRSGFGSQFHGLYVSTTRLVPQAVVEPYVFWRADRNLRTDAGSVGHLSLGTVGVRVAGQLPGGVDYASESVLQRGGLGADTIDVSVTTWLPLTAAYHSWWLASPADALYNAPGAVVARIAAGAPSRHVGHGFDVQTAWTMTRRLHAAAGYAAIAPGGFLRTATPGASFQSLYLMLTVGVGMDR